MAKPEYVFIMGGNKWPLWWRTWEWVRHWFVKPWSPFSEEGYVDYKRLQREGWTIMGALKDGDEIR